MARHVRDVLVEAGRDRGPADALAHRDSRVIGVAAGVRLQHQLVAVEHVEVDRGVGRAGGADLLGRGAEQLLPARVAREGAPQRRDHPVGVEHGHAQPPRVPSVARTVVTCAPRRITISTMSPGLWLRSASVIAWQVGHVHLADPGDDVVTPQSGLLGRASGADPDQPHAARGVGHVGNGAEIGAVTRRRGGRCRRRRRWRRWHPRA